MTGKRKVLLVGHDPELSELASELIGAPGLQLKKGALARIDAPSPSRQVAAPCAGSFRPTSWADRRQGIRRCSRPQWPAPSPGYAIAIPVGAIAVLIIHTAVTHGLRAGLAAGAGAASADFTYAAIAVIVGGAAAALISGIETPLQIVAGVALVALGCAVLWACARHTIPPPAGCAPPRTRTVGPT